MTNVVCENCGNELSGKSWDLPTICNECGGTFVNADEPEKPEEQWTRYV